MRPVPSSDYRKTQEYCCIPSDGHVLGSTHRRYAPDTTLLSLLRCPVKAQWRPHSTHSYQRATRFRKRKLWMGHGYYKDQARHSLVKGKDNLAEVKLDPGPTHIHLAPTIGHIARGSRPPCKTKTRENQGNSSTCVLPYPQYLALIGGGERGDTLMSLCWRWDQSTVTSLKTDIYMVLYTHVRRSW